jgi:hypothetical protein
MPRFGARIFIKGCKMQRLMIKYVTVLLLVLSWPVFAETIPDYNRGDWKHWIDHDGDCLDTRHELLLRESLTAVTFKTNNHCSSAWLGVQFEVNRDGILESSHILTPVTFA